VVIGQRVWDVQSKVRVVAGPLNYPAFRSLLPGGSARRPFADLCRAYLGLELDVDVQAVLAPDAVPWAELTHDDGRGPRLGDGLVRTHNFG
jgi:type VI secretion system protein ImpH